MVTRVPLCPGCLRESDAWLDYRLPPAPIRLISIGNRPCDVKWGQQARLADWHQTITSAQRLIAEHCAANHTSSEVAS